MFYIESYEDTGSFRVMDSAGRTIIEDTEVKLKHLLTLLYEAGSICTYSIKPSKEL